MAGADYVENVRRRLGHELLLLPAVTVLPVDAEGQLLLVRHAAFDRWATLGGAIEVDEAPVAAAARECHEEIGTVALDLRVIDATGGPAFRVTYPNGDRCAYVNVVFEARVVAEEIVPDGTEVTAVRWFTRDELAREDELTPFARALLTRVGWL